MVVSFGREVEYEQLSEINKKKTLLGGQLNFLLICLKDESKDEFSNFGVQFIRLIIIITQCNKLVYILFNRLSLDYIYHRTISQSI